MIQAYRPARRSALLGTTLLATLGWVSFTSAASPDAPASPKDATQLKQIEVERMQEPAPWRTALESVLDKEVTLHFEQASPAEAAAYLRTITGANIVLQQSLVSEYDLELKLAVSATPLRDVLDLVCRLMTEDTSWALINQAIYIGEDAFEREPKELRFYRIAPFFEGGLNEKDVGKKLRRLVIGLVYPHVDVWDAEGVRIEAWKGLLIVSQTPGMHARVEALLERLLNRGAQPEHHVPEWRERAQAQLVAPSEVDADGITLDEVCALLSERHGVSIVCPEIRGREDVSLTLSGVSLGTALDWLCAGRDLRVAIEGGAILLEEGGLGELTLEFYELGPVHRALENVHVKDVQAVLQDMIIDQIDPESWDTSPRCAITFWRDMMLVTHTPAAHAEVRLLLDALERAVKD